MFTYEVVFLFNSNYIIAGIELATYLPFYILYGTCSVCIPLYVCVRVACMCVCVCVCVCARV